MQSDARMPSSSVGLASRMGSATLWCTVLAAQAAIWWRAVGWFGQLPDKFPSGFDAAGNPRGSTATTAAAWFALPSLALVLAAFIVGIALLTTHLVVHRPKLVNTPSKELFLLLSPEARRRAVAGPTRAFLLWTLFLMSLLFLWIVEGTALVAVGRAATLPSWPVFVFLGLEVLTLPVFLVVVVGRVKREADAEGVTMRDAMQAARARGGVGREDRMWGDAAPRSREDG
jgi:hypothetical protein